MSRTIKKVPKNYFRNPQTFNEHKQLVSLIELNKEVKLAKLNHIRKRALNLPTAWDDLYISSRGEMYRRKEDKKNNYL